MPALAACPIELAVYGDRDQVAEIDFTPADKLATVTNAFRMNFEHGIVLDGFVMWTDGVERPYGTLTYKCPTGDVTGEEMDACTIWQGVVYSVDDKGEVGLLPQPGTDAPKTLVFPDLAQTIHNSTLYGPTNIEKLPWDVFSLKGCQE